jgi:4-carboxymuconolactone decarboxylase
MADQPTAAREAFGKVAPKFAEITDTVLFGDVWARPELSPRARSLITGSALIALDRPDELFWHLKRELANGDTRELLVEMVTHLAFYAGWPSAHSAIVTLQRALDEADAG